MKGLKMSKVKFLSVFVYCIMGVVSFSYTPAFSQLIDDNLTTEEEMLVIAHKTQIAFSGKILHVEFQCQGEFKSYAYVDVDIDNYWYGYCESPIRVRIAGVEIPECPSISCKTHPDSFTVGSRYLFLCSRDWSRDKHEFEDTFFTPFQGVLCLDSSGEVSYCNGGVSFSSENPSEKFQSSFDMVNIPQMFEDSDLVIVAKGFEISGINKEFKYQKPKKGLNTCITSEVLKGSLLSSEINFEGYGNLTNFFTNALLGSADSALLFLEMDDSGEYGLLYGGKSYCPLDGDYILNNFRIKTGYKLIDGSIVKTTEMEGLK